MFSSSVNTKIINSLKSKRKLTLPHIVCRGFIFNRNESKSPQQDEVQTKELIEIKEIFNEEGLKSNYDGDRFNRIVNDFDTLRRLRRFGYTEFIAAALPAMKEFGVEKDIESYKALMRVFPRGAFQPSSRFTAGFYPHFMQQTTAIKILMQMEENYIIPDKELQTYIADVFSKRSLVWERSARMIYWMTKFRNANPFPLPETIPNDSLELAVIALKRMTFYIDPQTEIYVYRTHQIDESAENTWLCFAQSESQCQLIEELDFSKYTVSIEGPKSVWVDEHNLSYFVLEAKELNPKTDRDLVEEFLQEEQENDDVSNIPLSNFGSIDYKNACNPMLKVHQFNDGIILACLTSGTSSQQSMILSLKKLEEHNPKLSDVQVIISSR
ncbi:Evolutionarily conserved signaling intermediate in Toll pathway [Sarcoptes scabiei]|uniref:Evolutionarily conserved signaling intermediate in Toll pathway, mitochondrial n=1 Tax=Sarcoptes scabiei TaxID=52283 RepID=A0A834REF8_SARSC|nr:Evolutionarily conserved signaling intermediate in Toll pathway [Sarcoptes scabiei]